MISDPDLEAKTRFSPRSILDDSFLGEEVALWRGVVGSCPGCPEGGKGVEGWWRGLHPVPSHVPFQGKWLRTLVFTGQSLGPGSPLMIPLVPGPAYPVLASCRCPCRCNRQGPILKSPSESDTLPRLVRRRFAAEVPEQCFLFKSCARSSSSLSRFSAEETLISST
jgi:hypothetical protein